MSKDNREYIPYLHNGKLILVPVLEPEELKSLDSGSQRKATQNLNNAGNSR